MLFRSSELGAFSIEDFRPAFYNTSPLDLKKQMGDQDNIGENLRSYMQALADACIQDAIVQPEPD